MSIFHQFYKPHPEQCYKYLVEILHGKNFKCPNGHALSDCYIHNNRKHVIIYRCKKCGKVFNLFTGTSLKGTKYNVVQLILILDRLSREYSVSEIAKELGIDRAGLKRNLSKFQELIEELPSYMKAYYKPLNLLMDVEDWKVIDDPNDLSNSILILKFQFGKYYALSRKRLSHITSDQKKLKTEYTDIQSLSPWEFKLRFGKL